MAERELQTSRQNQTNTVMFVVIVLLAFVVGMMWQKINTLQGGRVASATSTPVATGQPGVRLSAGKMSVDNAKKIPVVSDSDHVRGTSDPQVYLIEYSDFECPFCKRYHETAKQLLDEYGDKMAWIYRQFPLDQLHQKARIESEASECVASIGGNDAFWKFIDLIYEVTTSNDGLDTEKLPEYAATVGVEGSKFQDCMDIGALKDVVEAQYRGGLAAGITGTPGSFIVNKKGEAWFVPGALPYDTLKQMIDEALASN